MAQLREKICLQSNLGYLFLKHPVQFGHLRKFVFFWSMNAAPSKLKILLNANPGVQNERNDSHEEPHSKPRPAGFGIAVTRRRRRSSPINNNAAPILFSYKIYENIQNNPFGGRGGARGRLRPESVSPLKGWLMDASLNIGYFAAKYYLYIITMK